MPKRKGLSGIGNAFGVDVKHVTEGVQQELDENEDSFKRVTISLSPSLLKKLDKTVKEQKQKGVSVNRSSYIARAVMSQIEQDLST
jgi:hypothetical protein